MQDDVAKMKSGGIKTKQDIVYQIRDIPDGPVYGKIPFFGICRLRGEVFKKMLNRLYGWISYDKVLIVPYERSGQRPGIYVERPDDYKEEEEISLGGGRCKRL